LIVRRVLQRIAPFNPATTGAEALACFAADSALRTVPVVDHEGYPLGLVSHTALRLKMSDKSGHEMFAHGPITLLMDPGPLVVEADTPIKTLCETILPANPQAFRDGFIITQSGSYAGFGEGAAVMDVVARENAAMTERLTLAMNAARAAVWEVDFIHERLLGAETLDRIYGRRLTFDDVRRLSQDFVAGEDREAARRALANIASSGGRGRLQTRIVRGDDGRERWVEHTVEMFRDEQERIERIVLLTADVTRRRSGEIRFGASINKMVELLEGKRALVARLSSEAELPQIERIDSRSGSAATYEHHAVTASRMDGIIREIALRDEALAHAVEAAESANQAKSRFLASMSHELRTPLNAIIGYAEILEEDLTDAALQGPVADAVRIRGAARHLLNLINEILDLSKIEAGRMDVSTERFDVGASLRELVETVRPLATKNMNDLVVEIEPDLGEAVTDSVKLNQCLMNLVSNACKFTSAGEVRVTARRARHAEGDQLLFEIADSGIGMNEEQLAKLFQPFMQADASTTRNYGGTGLGLAITQRLARLLGGDVTVRSAPGEGTTFTLSVPSEYRARAGAETAAAHHDADDRPRVLIIDDDAAARDLARRSLSRLGFSITDAADGQTGLSLARAHRYALIVLDLASPNTSGWSALEELKRDPTLAETPVLAISVEDDRARALSLGASELLVKPIERDTLAASAVRFARFDHSSTPTQSAPAARNAA
jgi:PAS domain S-box-containing protein